MDKVEIRSRIPGLIFMIMVLGYFIYFPGRQGATIVPTAIGMAAGKKRGLHIDDGLGEYLVRLGLAKPFLLYSEWKEEHRLTGSRP